MQELTRNFFEGLFLVAPIAVTVYDGRTDHPTSERFDQPFSLILNACNEAPKTLDQIRRAVAEQAPASQASSGVGPSIDAAVSTLVAKRLMVEEKGRHFTLALPVNPHL